MNVILKPILTNALLAMLLVGGLVGCSQIRQLTYPEDFTYLEKGQVESLMREMGDTVGRLGQLVSKTSSSEINQQQVIASLSELESITSRIIGGHTQTNQLFISEHIEQFVTDVGTAKMFVKTSPPNYSKAREITNSCQKCHSHAKD
jgi:hypothetical protein